jgi:soluble lytic murein transglycosylase-like protein
MIGNNYGAVAAYLSGAYYLKLAGEKYSEKEFGGVKYNQFSTSKIFVDEVGYE